MSFSSKVNILHDGVKKRIHEKKCYETEMTHINDELLNNFNF